MKKMVYTLAVLFSVALVSCGGNKAAEATDSDSIVAEEVVAVESVDSNGDTAAAVAVEEVVEAPAADSAAK